VIWVLDEAVVHGIIEDQSPLVFHCSEIIEIIEEFIHFLVEISLTAVSDEGVVVLHMITDLGKLEAGKVKSTFSIRPSTVV
jgi:hypothetical protein